MRIGWALVRVIELEGYFTVMGICKFKCELSADIWYTYLPWLVTVCTVCYRHVYQSDNES